MVPAALPARSRPNCPSGSPARPGPPSACAARAARRSVATCPSACATTRCSSPSLPPNDPRSLWRYWSRPEKAARRAAAPVAREILPCLVGSARAMKGAPLSALMPILASSLRLGRLDPGVLILCLSIATIGLVILNSASEGNDGLVLRQASRLAIGFLALWVCAQIPPFLARGASHPISISSLVSPGPGPAGRRGAWGGTLGSISGFCAFSPRSWPSSPYPWPAPGCSLARASRPAGGLARLLCHGHSRRCSLIQLQPDLGTAILVGARRSRSGLPRRPLLAADPPPRRSGARCDPGLVAFLHECQKMRIRTLFAPDADPLGHALEHHPGADGSRFRAASPAKVSGQGTQAHLAFLPEHTTDFAFAVLAEEFGFVGVALSLLLYFALGLRILWLAMGAPSPFGRLLVGALGSPSCSHLGERGDGRRSDPRGGRAHALLSYGGTIAVTMMAKLRRGDEPQRTSAPPSCTMRRV